MDNSDFMLGAGDCFCSCSLVLILMSAFFSLEVSSRLSSRKLSAKGLLSGHAADRHSGPLSDSRASVCPNGRARCGILISSPVDRNESPYNVT